MTQQHAAKSQVQVIEGDCLAGLPTLTERPNLIFTSPPYEDARTYGMDFRLKGDAWVQWAADRFMACLDVCDGLVAWVVQGRTQRYQWSATPAMLICELQLRGAVLRNPAIYVRDGIPGSGGPDWLKSRYEWIVCATRERGRLPWSDNTAMGWAPKYPTGGAMSNRTQDGRRKNARGHGYTLPKISNPGNVIDCGAAGGGHLGDRLAHENEAPFPEKLAAFFVRSFCPPDGLVCDPFCGSGTTLKVAAAHGRRGVGIDVRPCQVELTGRRLAEGRA